MARAFGINVRRPGGSFVYFTHPAVREGVSVPARALAGLVPCADAGRRIKPAYVRAFVRLVDLVRQA